MESLEEVFKESRYPDVYRREEIAATLDLKEEVVRVSPGVHTNDSLPTQVQ